MDIVLHSNFPETILDLDQQSWTTVDAIFYVKDTEVLVTLINTGIIIQTKRLGLHAPHFVPGRTGSQENALTGLGGGH